MSFLALLLMFTCIHQAIADTKFIEIPGNVTDQGNYGILYEPAEDCLSICYYNSTCFMAYIVSSSVKSEKSCNLYYFLVYPKLLTVEITKKEDGRLVYMKTTFTSDECPSSYKNINYTVPSGYGDTYTWTTTPTGWSFQACRDGWHRSERSNNVSVCMKGVRSSVDLTRQMAMTMCENTGANLVGVDTVEESQWMKSQAMLLTTSKSSTFWIDGERNCTSANTTKCDIYTYTDGFTSGNSALVTANAALSYINPDSKASENCLTIVLDLSPNQTINDLVCNHSGEIGAFCGYRLY